MDTAIVPVMEMKMDNGKCGVNPFSVDKVVDSVKFMNKVLRNRRGMFLVNTIVSKLHAKLKPGETFTTAQIAEIVMTSKNNIWRVKSMRGLTCTLGDILGQKGMGLRRRDRGTYIVPEKMPIVIEGDNLMEEAVYPTGDAFRHLDGRLQGGDDPSTPINASMPVRTNWSMKK